jgi:trigger factor
VHEFDHDEARLTQYVESQGQTREEFDAEIRTNAEQAVKTQLLLDEVAEKGEVQVDQQELMERIFMQAQRFGISPEEYIQQAQQANQLGAIFADVRRGKALASVVQAATITGPDGEEVDLSELFGPGAGGDDADAEAAAEIADETVTAASGDDEAGEDEADAVVSEEEATASASSAPQV